MNKYLSFVKDVINFSVEKGVSRHAKALTYSSVLALVPLLTVFLSSFAKSSWMNKARDAMQNLFLENLFPEKIAETIGTYFLTMVNSAQKIQAFGMIGFVVVILFLFLDMEDTFLDMVHKKESKRWYMRLATIFSLLIVPILLFVVVGLFEWVLEHSPGIVQSIFQEILRYPEVLKMLVAVFLWAWILFLYKFLPHKKLNNRCLLIGSFLATVSILLLQLAFSLYLQIFKHYEIIYGVFSLIPVFLIWMYLMWQIVLHCFVIALFCEIYQKDKTGKTGFVNI